MSKDAFRLWLRSVQLWRGADTGWGRWDFAPPPKKKRSASLYLNLIYSELHIYIDILWVGSCDGWLAPLKKLLAPPLPSFTCYNATGGQPSPRPPTPLPVPGCGLLLLVLVEIVIIFRVLSVPCCWINMICVCVLLSRSFFLQVKLSYDLVCPSSSCWSVRQYVSQSKG